MSHDRHVEQMMDDSERFDLLAIPSTDLERRVLRRRVCSGELVEPHPGMFARAEVWAALKWKVRAWRVVRTYASLHPDCVFCSMTAAFIHGLWVPKSEVMGAIHVVGPHARVSRGVMIHAINDSEVDLVGDLMVTSSLRTAFDCMAALDFRNGLAVGDSLARACSLNQAELLDMLANRYAGYRGMGSVRLVMPHVDARSESGGESYARAVMIENQVMVPELQVEVPRPDGSGRVYRFDYYWDLPHPVRMPVAGARPFSQVGGELDGMEKTEDEGMLGGRSMNRAYRDERTRESQITALGIPVLRFTFDMARDTWPLLKTLDMFGIPRG